jgi:hypothetical protein
MAEKKARSREKAIMRHLVLEATSGSEDRITLEEEWVSKNCKWTDSDDDQPAVVDEEAEEQEEEEQDGDDDVE